ncbi:MAG: PilZ domain-containing protein [Armatimonadetes bacterium]|nr:PilZ domain-containing protein [Armatimonadota bacterium]
MSWTSMFDSLVDALKGMSQTQHLVERRGHYRIPCRRAVNIILPKAAVGGHMLNLSPRGMKVRTNDRLPMNRELRLVVSGAKKGTEQRFIASIDLVCRVVWCKFSKLHEAFDAGLEYLPAPGVDLEYVDAFFRHELGLEDTETFQRRTSRRVSTELDVTCWTPDGAVMRGAIRDLSLHGAQFEGNLALPMDSEVRLAIEVAGRKDPLYFVSRVVRCKRLQRDAWYELGVSFVEVNDKDRAALKRFLSKELRQSS